MDHPHRQQAGADEPAPVRTVLAIELDAATVRNALDRHDSGVHGAVDPAPRLVIRAQDLNQPNGADAMRRQQVKFNNLVAIFTFVQGSTCFVLFYVMFISANHSARARSSTALYESMFDEEERPTSFFWSMVGSLSNLLLIAIISLGLAKLILVKLSGKRYHIEFRVV